MANEAVLVVEIERPLPFTVANATGINKGAVLKMTDPRTAALADGTNDIVAGILAVEKVASDGRVTGDVYRRGWFKMTGSGSITAGDPVGTIASYNNYVASNKATQGLSGMRILGYALETSTNGETLLVDLNPQAVTYL